MNSQRPTKPPRAPRHRAFGRPRLPWKRGPVAWSIARRADEVGRRLESASRNFFSLRRTAAILGVSTQPVRAWVRLGHLRRDGPRGQVAKAELTRFVGWLRERAEPFDNQTYTRRLTRKPGSQTFPFQALAQAQFLWPKGRPALTLRELAALIGCHPSLLIKAIKQYPYRRLGRRKSPGRWEITRRAWQGVFPSSRIAKPTLPPLPRAPHFTILEAARHLRAWGLAGASPYRVRCLVKAGELEMLELTGPGRRKLGIARPGLEKMRRKMLTRLPQGIFGQPAARGPRPLREGSAEEYHESHNSSK